MFDNSEFSIALADETATKRFGEDLASALRKGDVVLLEGDLGTGKSTLARSIIHALAANQDLDVPSPTFTLVQTYQTTPPVHHYDLYRLHHEDEISELGFDEASVNGICLVEWPQMAPNEMPKDGLSVRLKETSEGGRTAELSGPATKIQRVERAYSQRQFLTASGWGQARREYLTGDASSRRYERVLLDEKNAILVDSPSIVPIPVSEGTKSYMERAHIATDASAFVAVAGMLRQRHLRVPEIFAWDRSQGFLLIENLGSDGLLDRDGAPISERYLAAAEMLAITHTQSYPRSYEKDGLAYVLPSFDQEVALVELDLLLEWYAPERLGGNVSSETRDQYRALWSEALGSLDVAQNSLMLRDFHSPNILWQSNAQGIERVGLIDFQDALWGPPAYDLASLALDARVDIPVELEKAIFAAYLAIRKASNKNFDAESFGFEYAVVAAQRNSKILGIFNRLNRRDGKPGYLRHIPRIQSYLARAMAHPKMKKMRDFYLTNGWLDEK